MLQILSIYILKVILISALLLAYYIITLRNKRFHYYNRFYLLFAVILSMVLPFIHFEWFSFESNSAKTIKLYNLMYANGGEIIVTNKHTSTSWQDVVLYATGITCCILMSGLIVHIVRLYIIKKKYPVQKMNDVDFINTDVQQAPFSFLKNIFWRNDISLDDETGKQILQHELTHVQQKHSHDKLFMQSVMCFFWMNPFFWLMRKELYIIHEFIADEKAVGNSDAATFAEMLLTAQLGKFNYLPAQSIYYSSIKRRLLMLTQSKNPRFTYLRRLMVLPLIIIVTSLFAFTIKHYDHTTQSNFTKAEQPFTLIVDAGHGGKDLGAVEHEIKEKDITLSLAQKIKFLAPKYGVDVLLTRSGDEYMSPAQRADWINKQKANACISLHVNNSTIATDNGMETMISRDDNNGRQNESRIFGSAIIQTLSTSYNITPALLQRKASIWILQSSNLPIILLECGYINNTTDMQILNNDATLNDLANKILSGVAVYANNKMDKDHLYDIKKTDNEDTLPKPSLIKLDAGGKTLFVINGKESTYENFIRIKNEDYMNLNVLNDSDAVKKYGEKGKYGVVELTTKHLLDIADATPTGEALYVLDGVIISKDDLKNIAKDNIKEINVLKEKSATDKYGNKGKNGVVEIVTKPKKSLQQLNSSTNNNSTEKVFTQADQPATFHGGQHAWQNFLIKNLNVKMLGDKNAPPGYYKVTLSFLVNKDGKVSEVKALNDPGYGTAQEAERVMNLSPAWDAIRQNNIEVSYRVLQSIMFVVKDDNQEPVNTNSSNQTQKVNYRFNVIDVHPTYGSVSNLKKC